jgi:hypothetical protein
MTISDVMHEMLDKVTDEEKKQLREKIEQGAGSPYHRTLLAMFRDYEREIEKLKTEVVAARLVGKAEGAMQERERGVEESRFSHG